jgi:hypothetical protein
MKRLLAIGAIALTISSLLSCEMLLVRRNLFANLEPNAADKYASMSAADTVTNLERDKKSPTFYEDLKADPATLATVTTNLDAVIAAAASQADVQEAALLKTDIILNTTSSGEVVNSLVSGLVSGMSSGTGSGSAGASDLIASIIAPVQSVVADETAFTAFVDSMTSLAADYTTIAATLADPSAPQELPAATAQAAAIAFVVDTLVANIDLAATGAAASTTFATPTEALFAMVTAATDGDASTNVPLTLTDSAAFTTLMSSGSDLMNILSAAGLGSFADMLSGSL